MKGETTCSKVVELRVEMNRKAPLSLASDSRELQLQMGPLGVALGPLGGLAVAGWGQDPHRGSPGLEWLLCTQNISLQRHWWGDGAGKLPHHCRIHYPEPESQSPRLSQPPQGLGLCTFVLFLSFPSAQC